MLLDFSDGIEPGKREEEYQAWLAAHPDGLVLSLNAGRDGRWTLHSARCQTLSFDFVSAGHSQRSGKVCRDNNTEIDKWLTDHSRNRSELNTCSRCLKLEYLGHEPAPV